MEKKKDIAGKEEMKYLQNNLKTFAEKYCDGLYDSKFDEELQCSGWKVLKELVENKVENPTLYQWNAFHPNLRTYLKSNWTSILKLKI